MNADGEQGRLEQVFRECLDRYSDGSVYRCAGCVHEDVAGLGGISGWFEVRFVAPSKWRFHYITVEVGPYGRSGPEYFAAMHGEGGSWVVRSGDDGVLAGRRVSSVEEAVDSLAGVTRMAAPLFAGAFGMTNKFALRAGAWLNLESMQSSFDGRIVVQCRESGRHHVTWQMLIDPAMGGRIRRFVRQSGDEIVSIEVMSEWGPASIDEAWFEWRE